MYERENGSTISAFMAGMGIGAIIGAAAGVLLAPKSGAEMRHQIGEKYGEVKGRVKGWVKDARGKASDALDEVAEHVHG
jgi:gas vesicle protein